MKQTFNGRELTERHTVRGVEWFGQSPLGLIELKRMRLLWTQTFECRLDGATIGRSTRPGRTLRAGEKWLNALLRRALAKRAR